MSFLVAIIDPLRRELSFSFLVSLSNRRFNVFVRFNEYLIKIFPQDSSDALSLTLARPKHCRDAKRAFSCTLNFNNVIHSFSLSVQAINCDM
jgi:hypothetical protein